MAARGDNWKPEKMLEAEDPSKPALQAPRMGVNLDLEATHSARLDKSTMQVAVSQCGEEDQCSFQSARVLCS